MKPNHLRTCASCVQAGRATEALRGEIQPGEPRKWPEMMGVNYDEPMRHGKEN